MNHQDPGSSSAKRVLAVAFGLLLLLGGEASFGEAAEVSARWLKNLERSPAQVLEKLGAKMQARLRDAADRELCSCRCRMPLMRCLETDKGCSLRPEHARRVGQILTALRGGQVPAPPPLVVSEEDLRRRYGITLDQARRMYGSEGVVFVDARSRRVFDMGHISGAIDVSPHEFAEKYPALEARLKSAKVIIVYCGKKCGASALLARRLLDKGVRNIRILVEGWDGWEAMGYPESRSRGLP